jgi:N-acetylmuramoyl-L-alanine amidase
VASRSTLWTNSNKNISYITAHNNRAPLYFGIFPQNNGKSVVLSSVGVATISLHLQSTTQPNTLLTLPVRQIANTLLLALLTSLSALSQQPVTPQPRTVILLDPAHGGSDTGAHLSDEVLEKDLTLAFAVRLRAALAAAGLTVISTRDSDPAVPFTTDQRAEIANQRHPTACIILHESPSGDGIHVITSALRPADELDDPHVIPWNTAQATYLASSQRLANQIGVALIKAKLPVLLSKASVRPLDNLTCPAVAIEIAPLTPTDDDPTPVTNVAYQQRIAKAIVDAVTIWRTHEVQAAVAAGAAR